ncbi:MAG: Mini-ribonuclease 3 [Solobacterium sp.]|nr:Mini-ribonuclease 3 [Solobacterium sp.]
MKSTDCSGRTLAFLGDAVWSLLVRRDLIENGEGKGNDLQRKSVKYVSAKAQAAFYDALHASGFLTEEEEEYFRRGRNANAGSVPRSTPVAVYRKSTGFEAMIGALELEGKRDRIEEIWKEVGNSRR